MQINQSELHKITADRSARGSQHGTDIDLWTTHEAAVDKTICMPFAKADGGYYN